VEPPPPPRLEQKLRKRTGSLDEQAEKLSVRPLPCT
jgi:hypothetical protein